MPTIKGGISFKKGQPVPEKFLDALEKVALPFEATGWESTKGMDLIPDEFKAKGTIKKVEEKPIDEVKPDSYPELTLRSMKFNELRKLASEYGVKGRSFDEIIGELKEKGVVE